MGGYLTVSSVEHHGSTFTFVLPYKVSSISDSSDDTDELSDTEHQDVLGDDGNDDDLRSGVFVFQPRTLGSLFSSQTAGRIPKLLPNTYGMSATEDCSLPSSDITYKQSFSSEDSNSPSSSKLEMQQTSCVSASDSSKSAAKQEQSYSEVNGRFHPYDHPTKSLPASNADDGASETCIARVKHQAQPRTDTGSDCSSRNSPQVETKHKILLVEDNKINIMVAKSMMKQLGYTIDVVSDGAEAVRAVQCNTYNLIFMVRIEI